MAIDRTNYNALVDDDGSNTVGTVLQKTTFKDVVLDPIDAEFSAIAAAVRGVAAGGTGVATFAAHGVLIGNVAGALAVTGAGTAGQVLTSNGAAADPTFQAAAAAAVAVGVCDGRLTLTSGFPVTTADVTGATQVLFTPYKGKHIALYDGTSSWALVAFAETALSLSGATASLPYDIFAYNNAGTLALEKLAWTNGTTRATAFALQDGVYVKSGATTRRYLGTLYTTGTGTTEDSAAKRFLWNYYNRRPRRLARVESTANWTYTTATIRQVNAAAANKVEVIIGVVEDPIDVTITAAAANGSNTTMLAGIGLNSTTAFATDYYNGGGSTQAELGAYVRLVGFLKTYPPIGYSYVAMLEASSAVGTTTWYSSITGFGERLATLSGIVHA